MMGRWFIKQDEDIPPPGKNDNDEIWIDLVELILIHSFNLTFNHFFFKVLTRM